MVCNPYSATISLACGPMVLRPFLIAPIGWATWTPTACWSVLSLQRLRQRSTSCTNPSPKNRVSSGTSWYILKADARGSKPPSHAFRKNLVDRAWALHRAHWLAEQYVALQGCPPSDLVQPPTWAELEEGLKGELDFIEGLLTEGRDDADHAAFAIWNACRIIYSLETHDVVVSKRAAALWALQNLSSTWHAAIRAAGRVYDGQAAEDDEAVLRSSLVNIVSAARDRISNGITW